MEPNHKPKEDAAFYALDLLDSKERAAYDKASRRDPSLKDDCALTEDAIAAIALTAPPHAAPDILSDIHAELGPQSSTPHRPAVRSLWPYVGWATAACLLGGRLVSYHHTNSLRREIVTLRESNETPGQVSHSVNNPPFLTDSDRETLNSVLRNLQPEPAGEARLVPVEALRDLRNKLDRYVNMHESRFDPVPGLARWVVTEMRDPSDSDSESSTRVFDAQDIANVMAAAIEASDGGEPLVLDGADGRWNGQLKIVNGMLDLSSFNLDEDTVITQEDFPESNWQDIPSLEQLGDGLFFHSGSNYLYERTPDGRYVGTRPPEDFDPEAYQPPHAEVGSEGDSSISSPKAITYFNEVTGNGSVYVRDLPSLDEGINYHLWLKDTESNDMINVGPLPVTDGSTELIDFPHGLPGTTPSGYLITRETKPDPPVPTSSESVLVWP
jgi:hypothetical protein